jgi:hypothetical protein
MTCPKEYGVSQEVLKLLVEDPYMSGYPGFFNKKNWLENRYRNRIFLPSCLPLGKRSQKLLNFPTNPCRNRG